jgi:hypothetical protein
MAPRCSSRSPSGRLCDRFDRHDGDHRSADERAWATAYHQRLTVGVESAELADPSAKARPMEPPDETAEELEAQINSTLHSISQLQVQLANMKRSIDRRPRHDSGSS